MWQVIGGRKKMLRITRFTNAFLASIFLLMDVMLGPAVCSWRQSHLVKLGTRLSINCPHTFPDLEVEWEMENHDGSSQEISREEALNIDPVGLKHSGKYSCFENVWREGEKKFEHHKTQVLVVDYHCSCVEGDSSQNIKCSMNYESDDGHKVQVYRLCKIQESMGELVLTQERADGRTIHHEIIIEKEKQNCIFLIKFLDSSLRFWPRTYDGKGQSCSQPKSQPIETASLATAVNWTTLHFVLNVVMPILTNCVVVVLTVVLACVVITANKRSKVKINNWPNSGEYLSSLKSPARYTARSAQVQVLQNTQWNQKVFEQPQPRN